MLFGQQARNQMIEATGQKGSLSKGGLCELGGGGRGGGGREWADTTGS